MKTKKEFVYLVCLDIKNKSQPMKIFFSSDHNIYIVHLLMFKSFKEDYIAALEKRRGTENKDN